jgi:hypothetical protein|tara:strand:+ start:44 stop:295 length:252 start_codon:yes stop_codon:yes gene_type:complete
VTLGQWLKSLSGLDHGILVVLYLLGIYLSKITLEALIEFYDIKKEHSKFRVQFRVTPAALLSLAFIYSFLIYQVLDAMFGFMP